MRRSLSFGWAKPAPLLIGAAVLLASLLSARGGPIPGDGESSGTPPDATSVSDPEFDSLLQNLAEKAAVYESVALRFVCVETTRTSEKPLDEKKYDYMYVEAEAQRYRPYRQRHAERSSQNASEIEVETDFPDAYSWTLIFAPRRQHLFHFKYAGEEWFSLRKAHVIEFTAPLPFTAGRTIYEWSGKVWVDAENYNFLKIEATPTNQEERLRQLLRAYRQAPRFLIYPMARRPSGARYEITFLNQYQKLSLPDHAEYHQFTLDLEGNAELNAFRIHRYAQYQFFGVQLQDRFLK